MDIFSFEIVYDLPIDSHMAFHDKEWNRILFCVQDHVAMWENEIIKQNEWNLKVYNQLHESSISFFNPTAGLVLPIPIRSARKPITCYNKKQYTGKVSQSSKR